MNDYKPTSFPATFAAAAIALTALTIGLAVVLPMQTGSSASNPSASASPASSAPAPEVVAERIHVDVVADRPAGMREAWLPVEARAKAREAAPATGRSGARSVAAPERIGYHGAVAPVRCPYLINGTVDATS